MTINESFNNYLLKAKQMVKNNENSIIYMSGSKKRKMNLNFF